MPSFTWNEILPAIVSICIIIAIVVLKKYSDSFAAIAATMPVNLPLGMWVFMSGREDPDGTLLSNFTASLLLNMFPTVLFVLTAWLVLRGGGNLISAILIGYLVWGIGLGAPSGENVFWLLVQLLYFGQMA
jgi:hypothetical protein